MKILIIMGGFFPGRRYGGPPVSIENLSSLVNDFEYFVVTSNHDLGDSNKYSDISDGWNKRKDNLWVKYLSDQEYGIKQFESAIKDVCPDLIYLQGLFQRCVIPSLRLAKKYSIPVLLAPRGELCAGAFKKKYKKVPYIIYLQLTGLLDKVSFQSTSEEETQAIVEYLHTPYDRVFYLNNIPSLPSGTISASKKKQPGDGRFVFLSRIVEKKNLLFALQSLKSAIGNIQFDIYGPVEDPDYWERCKKEINSLPSNISVSYKGIVLHDEIHGILSSYHCFLFPTLSENYGHVIAESMISGCIPLISNQTPWSDVNDYSCGWAIALSDRAGFISAIQSVIDMNQDDFEQIKQRLGIYLANKFALETTRDSYQKVLFKVANK